MNHEAFERLPEEKQLAILTAGIDEFSNFSYSDANTDRITTACGISKGLLYHYFETKKGFYLYCLEHAMNTLTSYPPAKQEGDFYTILFAEMEQKMRLCAEHPAETRFINLASRESAKQIATEKNELLKKYAMQMQQRSGAVFMNATAGLPLKGSRQQAVSALLLYTNAVMNRYLVQYQNTPTVFFEKSEEISLEIKQYLDLMMHGICQEDFV